MLNAFELSKPVVGSSTNNKFGFLINSIPIDTRFHSPPEIPLLFSSPIIVLATSFSLSKSIMF